MNREKLIKFWYANFYFIVRFWYQLTVRLTRKKNIVLTQFSNPKEVAAKLNWGQKWTEDPFNGMLDYMPHPTKVQDRINKNLMLDDCDGHAIYWATVLLNSKLMKRTWISTIHFKKSGGSIGGHVVCLMEDFNGNCFWTDYNEPRAFQNAIPYSWVKQVCDEFDAKPIAMGYFEVEKINKNLTPIFKRKIITKTY